MLQNLVHHRADMPGSVTAAMDSYRSSFNSGNSEPEERGPILQNGLEEEHSPAKLDSNLIKSQQPQDDGVSTTRRHAHHLEQPNSNGEHKEAPLELQKVIKAHLRTLIKGPLEQTGLQDTHSKRTSLSTRIIVPEELYRSWTAQFRRFYKEQGWYDPAWDGTDLLTGYHRIISILIWIKYTEWNEFRNIFVDRNWNDDCLPFRREQLMNDQVLGDDTGEEFWEQQWMFCPLVIEEAQETKLLIGEEAQRRFPYVEKGQDIGNGASCTVFKQVIAARHLKYSTPLRKSLNMHVRPYYQLSVKFSDMIIAKACGM